MDKTWVKCLVCTGNGTLKDGFTGVIKTCPRCDGEKVEFTSILEETAEDARKAFGLD